MRKVSSYRVKLFLSPQRNFSQHIKTNFWHTGKTMIPICQLYEFWQRFQYVTVIWILRIASGSIAKVWHLRNRVKGSIKARTASRCNRCFIFTEYSKVQALHVESQTNRPVTAKRLTINPLSQMHLKFTKESKIQIPLAGQRRRDRQWMRKSRRSFKTRKTLGREAPQTFEVRSRLLKRLRFVEITVKLSEGWEVIWVSWKNRKFKCRLQL